MLPAERAQMRWQHGAQRVGAEVEIRRPWRGRLVCMGADSGGSWPASALRYMVLVRGASTRA